MKLVGLKDEELKRKYNFSQDNTHYNYCLYAIINEDSNKKEQIESLKELALTIVSQTRKIHDTMRKMSPFCVLRHDMGKHLWFYMYNPNTTLKIDYLAKSIYSSQNYIRSAQNPFLFFDKLQISQEKLYLADNIKLI